MTRSHPWIDAAEASGVLSVSRATLYAYVSRGLVRSQALPGSPRERRYSRDDVERLRRRTEERRDPAVAAARALHWGVPVLESSIALIDGARLFYRGHDAVVLSRSRSIAEVASLIWTGAFDGVFEDPNPPAAAGDRDEDLPFIIRAQSALTLASARDPLAFDLRPAGVAGIGWRILTILTHTSYVVSAFRRTNSVSGAKRTNGAPARRAHESSTIDRILARRWRIGDRGIDVLRSALILCADHELNVSSFTARCVASAGSNPYAVVIAGLSALQGPKHGGAGARVESLLESMRGARRLTNAVADRLRRGEPLEGFGHPLYRNGDPRATALLEMLRERYTKSPELSFVQDFTEAAASATREKPNIDFALAAAARVMGLPPGSPLTLFAIGRTIGWIGHAIEQYATDQLIRPRAKYVGVVPSVQ